MYWHIGNEMLTYLCILLNKYKMLLVENALNLDFPQNVLSCNLPHILPESG